MIRVEHRPHGEIEAWLARDPRLNVFALHVCRLRPDGASLAALDGERICGAVVGGRRFGIPPVQSDWLRAESAEASGALIAALAAEDRLEGLQLPWEGAEALLAPYPPWRVSRDVYLTRPPGPPPMVPRTGQALRVTASAVAGLDMAPGIREGIGALSRLEPDAALWALNVGGRLVALSDVMVGYGEVATVQQVFCAVEARRRGYARSLLAQILAEPEVAGRTLTWLASAENTASIALATGLGFGDTVALAFVERAPLAG